MAIASEIDLDVAILGGGFAGVYCAKALGKLCRSNPDFRVGLIARENYMVFQPMLPEVAGASLSPRHVVNPIRLLCRPVRIFKGEIRSIDVSDKIIHVNAGDFSPDVRVRFKELALCLGATIDLSRVPGMPEHALLMQNVGDAMKLRATVIGRFEEANLVSDPALRRRVLSFVVVGGGYSGVETAGEILDLMTGIHRFYGNVSRDDFRVVLVHSGSHLLPRLSRRLGEYARERLEKRGLEILLERRVKAVTAEAVTLDGGDSIPATTVVSTVGNAPHPVVIDLCRDLGVETVGGMIPVEASLRNPDFQWLWAAGDCAAVPMEGGKWCPATAQFAQRQGILLGSNLAATHQGNKIASFHYRGLGELAAIGHRTAVGVVFGFSFSGFLAWWMWRSVYLLKLPGLERKLRVLAEWTLDLFFPKDINLLNPRYTKPLRSIHMEKGEVLFHPGEPAFSIYFVKEGVIEIRDGERIVKAVRAGDYFGERALLEDRIWRYRAVAAEQSSLVGLGINEFFEIVSGSNALKRLFSRSAAAYLSQEDMAAMKSQLGESVLRCRVGDLMNRSVDAISPGDSVGEVLRLFRSHRHGSYPVVDSNHKVLGVIKRDDVYDFLKSDHGSESANIQDIPFGELPTTSEETPCAELADLFVRSGRNKIMVTDDEGRLQGLVTVMDLMAGPEKEA